MKSKFSRRSEYTDHYILKHVTLEPYFLPVVLALCAAIQWSGSLLGLAVVSAAFNFFAFAGWVSLVSREHLTSALYMLMKQRDSYSFQALGPSDLKGLSLDEIISRSGILRERIISSHPHVFQLKSLTGPIPYQVKCFGYFGGHSYIFLRDIPDRSNAVEVFKIFHEYGHLTNNGLIHAAYKFVAASVSAFASMLIIAVCLNFSLGVIVLVIVYAIFFQLSCLGFSTVNDLAAREVHADSFALSQFNNADDIRRIFDAFADLWNIQAAYLKDENPPAIVKKMEHAVRLHYMLEAEQVVRGGGRWRELQLRPRWSLSHVLHSVVFLFFFSQVEVVGWWVWWCAGGAMLLILLWAIKLMSVAVNYLDVSVIDEFLNEGDTERRRFIEDVIELLYKTHHGSGMERFRALRQARRLVAAEGKAEMKRREQTAQKAS